MKFLDKLRAGLSKTKNAFDKYISLTSKEIGESFSMDTSFAIMKSILLYYF